MTKLREAAEEFLAQPRIAVAGVSRDTKQPANLIYRRLRDTGHEVFAVNPKTDAVEGDHCFESVSAIPGGVDGVVIATPASAALDVATDCASVGVPRIWLHRGVGPGSSSDAAVDVLQGARDLDDPGRLPMHVRGYGRHRAQVPARDAARRRQGASPALATRRAQRL